MPGEETTEQCDCCFEKTREKAQARRAPETTEQHDCHLKKSRKSLS